MFICKECNAEYDEKPDYCLCGNNTFEYIKVKKSKFSNKAVIEKILKNKNDILSVLFFLICLFFSIYIWLFAGNSLIKEQINTSVKPKAEKKQVIPDINSIWKEKMHTETVIDTNVQQNGVYPYQETLKLNLPVERVTKPVKMTETKPVPKNNVSKPAPSPKPVQKPKNTNPANVSPKNDKVLIKSYNPNDPELLRYKSALRSALFSKFAVGSIQGGGTCIIEFTINTETGKLENRRFVQKSDNKQLNDAIYYMLMSVPHFAVPPESYGGEKIRMKFFLNSGYYEVSFI